MKKWRKKMNNFNQFINKEIVNSSGDRGSVVALTDERITIEFTNERKIFKPDLAFKSLSIKFVDETLNNEMMTIINGEQEKQENQQLAIKKINQETIKRNKRACDRYYELYTKEHFLKKLFGRDFVYPPFTEFKKKFPYAKKKMAPFQEKLHSIFWSLTRGD